MFSSELFTRLLGQIKQKQVKIISLLITYSGFILYFVFPAQFTRLHSKFLFLARSNLRDADDK